MEFQILEPVDHVKIYKDGKVIKNDGRHTVSYDPNTKTAKLHIKKCRPYDEAKYKVSLFDDKEEELDMCSFMCFVKGSFLNLVCFYFTFLMTFHCSLVE